MMTISRIVRIFMLGVLLIAPAPLAYGAPAMPATENIETLETPHFKILYQAPLAEAAPVLAGYCEEAYGVLTHLLDFEPGETIRVFLTDTVDTHNGWATVTPRNTMAIDLAGSGQSSQIYQPGNYLRRTIYHELMHVLSMDLRGGYNAALEKIFGKVDPTLIGADPLSSLMFLSTASPNMLAPNWYIEGIAMYAETEFAAPGRGRSTFGDMLFRTAVKDNNLIPYSQWYLETPRWPYGSAAYWYGMRLVQYLCNTSPTSNPVGETTRAVSRAFLFNFNSGIREVSRKNWKTLAHEMLTHERKAQSANIQTLQQTPFTDLQRLTPKDVTVQNVRFAGDTLFVVAKTEEERNRLCIYDPDTRELKNIGDAPSPSLVGAMSATPDGRHLYYTTLEVMDTENLRYELHRYDTETEKDVTLTRQGRYRSVDISPDGGVIAAVSQRSGITSLLEVPVDGAGVSRQEKILARVGLEKDIAAPRFSPDGSRIAFVESDGHWFDLKILDRSTGDIQSRWRTRSQIVAPTWADHGNQLVFGCDANGVYNLYRLALSGSGDPLAITHVWGGLFLPSTGPDNLTLAAIQYDGFGPHLVTVGFTPEASVQHPLPVITPRWIDGQTEPPGSNLPQAAAIDIGPAEKYNSLFELRPDFWTPWGTTSTYGAQAGLAAAFSDPSNHQNLLVMGGIETEYGSPIALVHHTYRGLKPDIILSAGMGQQVYPDLLTSPLTYRRFDYAEETRFAGAALSLPLWTRLERQITVNAGYEFLHRKVIDEAEEDYAGYPLHLTPAREDQGSFWGRLDYFSGTAHGRSVSVEDGSLISIGTEYSHPSLGGEINATRILVDVNQYIRIPWLRNHVLKLSGSYGDGWGDDYAQGLFGLGGSNASPAALTQGIPRTFGLRGYYSNFQTGRRAVRVGASYRFPVANLFKGVESAYPLYHRSLFMEVFYEGGRTDDDASFGDDIGWLNSAGAEINYGMSLLRFLKFAPGVGIAYAPQRNDRDRDLYEITSYFSLKLWGNF